MPHDQLYSFLLDHTDLQLSGWEVKIKLVICLLREHRI